MRMRKMLGVLLTGVLCIGGVSAQAFRSEEGPYQVKVLNESSCVESPSWFRANITSYFSKGRSLLHGQLSFTRDLKDVKFRIIVYYLDEKKVTVFDMRNQNCHNVIIEVILRAIAMPFNKQNCNIKAGAYEFHDLNADAILHTVVQSMWYGAAELRLEVAMRSLRLLCLDLSLVINKPGAKAR